MSLSDNYKRQRGWRDWPRIFDALPALQGQTVLDLGCGVGDQAAELVTRGARVIGVDMNEELLREAQSRHLANADFRWGDLREPLDLGVELDGVWCSFMAAYFPDLPAALASWTSRLRPGGWVALTEIDDFFGHEPLGARTKSLFGAYARDALAAKRYDFYMGRKLRAYLEQAGFTVSTALTLEDQELAFEGPARSEVVEAWRNRLDRMKLLQELCGPDFEQLREEFLGCLTQAGHRSTASIYCCIGTR
ncbi:MAG TPA: class I SAM-dependent methyltransferase [Thermoanaerobaculia bacterium]|nr:class I SAM-dependent methyltransferase [Thermoanaerobaculia bacterium]